METQSTIYGVAFIALGVVWLVVDPERLPGWLALDTFVRFRVVFALVTIGLGALILAPLVVS